MSIYNTRGVKPHDGADGAQSDDNHTESDAETPSTTTGHNPLADEIAVVAPYAADTGEVGQ